ncbi:MAG: 50S ribosomal protein L5 [Candidatus Andersenbacteria bacterium]|nr:50S ribosomal protein L5 [Candidatus Andersenbacteria bacterium]
MAQPEHKINKHAQPRITRVTLNVGVGKMRDDAGYLTAVRNDLRAISGQRPYERRARAAVAGFAMRAGSLVGLAVTLRGKRCADFVRRFVSATLPRVRDFRGISPHSLDGHGNLSVGLSEQLAFPEVHPEKTDVVFGVEVTLVTTARTDAEGLALFKRHGFPFTPEPASDLTGE